MMKLSEALRTYDTILENGPLGTRLKYDYQFESAPHMAIKYKEGREALNEIYRGDIAVAQESNLPIIVNAPTFRASRNHLRLQGLDMLSDISQINSANIDFIKNLRDSYKHLNSPIIIGAPLGSMNDAYSVNFSLDDNTAKKYHQEQMDIFKKADVDFVNIVTISSLSEALGISLAAQQSHIEYTIGFILNEAGDLLDGTLLHEAMRIIDNKTTQNPLGYLITCTHASIILNLVDRHPEYNRLIGIQPNGSHLSSKTLVEMTSPVADTPEKFAEDINKIRKRFNLKIIGGCCGTSREHLQRIAKN